MIEKKEKKKKRSKMQLPLGAPLKGGRFDAQWTHVDATGKRM